MQGETQVHAPQGPKGSDRAEATWQECNVGVGWAKVGGMGVTRHKEIPFGGGTCVHYREWSSGFPGVYIFNT